MAQASQLERLAEQRRRLVTQSDVLRCQMAEDIADLRRSVGWIERGYNLVRRGWAIWPILAALSGLLVTRAGGSWLAKAGKLVSWWRMTKKLSQIYRSFRAQAA